MPIVTLNQHADTPARRELLPGVALTYLYDRSRDSKKTNTPGQDFIAYCHAGDRLAFAVCDGVSQSFYGELAARFLGERLVDWLLARDMATLGEEGRFDEMLTLALNEWTDEASALVRVKPINPALPPIVRNALERKRENGSETMFVAGLIDFAGQILTACWMGDMRLWLWGQDGGAITFPEAAWETRERWSTRLGPKRGSGAGTPRTLQRTLEEVIRVTVHSDGIGNRAGELATISLAQINRIAAELSAAPASDDLSILDIRLRGQTPDDPDNEPLPAPVLRQPDPAEATLIWDEQPTAVGYRVEVTQDQHQWTVDVPTPAYFLPPEIGVGTVFRAQALTEDGTPGLWSAPFTLHPPTLAPPETKATFVSQAHSPTTTPIVTAVRPFRLAPIMILVLIEAAVIAIGWIVLRMQELRG